MKIIDLEAHFVTPEFLDFTDDGTPPKSELLNQKLVDLGDGRLRDMDEAGIDVQVISLFQPPHIQRLEPAAAITWARSTNEALSAAVEKHPDRYVGFAAIPVQSPDEAAQELERAVLELGLKGVCILSNAREEYFDNQKYWGIFETVQRLDVPINLHPAFPSTVLVGAYAGFEELSGPSHGFATEVSLHVMRLIHGSLFDRYPGLKMILGHMGEGLPFWLPRLDLSWLKDSMGDRASQKRPSEYLKQNFTVTTSGLSFNPALICAYLALGADNIAFAVDYPPEENKPAVEFIKAAPICDADKEKICYLNAEKLLKL